MAKWFPGNDWAKVAAEDAGFDAGRLDAAKEWLDGRAGRPSYRVVIVRGGALVAEWNRGIAREARLHLASAAKSIFSCMLGIAVACTNANEHGSGCGSAVPAMGFGLFVGSIVAGALLAGKTEEELLFQSGGTARLAPRVSVSPVFSRNAKGVALALAW